ncbi:LppA family lipoprotein [Mycoplasma feriruminatoris]|uniref:LppA family lipoprotein n=1 Tax=Mycoplasma feriruminatoris TaxID=1179777 RepID=A0ABY8HVU5_9MOLU|nr:LppA family lipoprotein [Mycoplasma feriruminatoris]WFQ93756.1 LppA family lipoprotein [Mycoplasma feriruminatoris]
MKKFSKLILAILPISSLTVFSVISCTSNNKKSDETSKISNNKTPDNQSKKPEDQVREENHKSDKTNEKVKPNGKPSFGNPDDQHTPNQLEHKPDNSEMMPKGPGANNHSNSNNDTRNNNPRSDDNNRNEEEPKDRAPRDEAPAESIDFSDIKSLKKEVQFQFYPLYKDMSAQSAWVNILANKSIFKEIIFKNNDNVLNNYEIEFSSDNKPEIVDEKGIIDKVKIKFTKKGKSFVNEFIFTGFKKPNPKVVIPKNKNDYITPKKIGKELSGLYPSLVAYMLLYVEQNDSNNKYDKDLKVSGNVINFEELKNTNTDLFNDDFVGFSVGTKELLFDYDKESTKYYKNQIIEAKFDDTNGTLGLKVKIQNREENFSNEHTIIKEYNFDGFRKIDFDNNKNNPFIIDFLEKDLKKILSEGKIINSLKKVGIDIQKTNISDFGIYFDTELWKTEIYKYLLIELADKKYNIYKNKQTLQINPNNKNTGYKSILGLKPNMSLYPFNTMITKDSIHDILLTIKNKEVSLEFELHLPIYATSFSDLTSHATTDKPLIIRVSQSTKID